jgi:hypothetical protein
MDIGRKWLRRVRLDPDRAFFISKSQLDPSAKAPRFCAEMMFAAIP